jgi:hypothetical protein
MSFGSKPALGFSLDGLVWCWLVNKDRPQSAPRDESKDLAQPEMNQADPAHKTRR